MLNFYNKTKFKDIVKVNWTTYADRTLEYEESDDDYSKLNERTKELNEFFKNYSATFKN